MHHELRLFLTFPLGRPSSFSAWKIPFSVLPEPNVRVILHEIRSDQAKKKITEWRDDPEESDTHPRTGILPLTFVKKESLIQLDKKKDRECCEDKHLMDTADSHLLITNLKQTFNRS